MKPPDAIRTRVTPQQQQFDRNGASEAHLVSPVDDTHAPMTDLFLEEVVSQDLRVAWRFSRSVGRRSDAKRESRSLGPFRRLVVRLRRRATFHATPTGAAGRILR